MLSYLTSKKIPYNSVNLAGGVACNMELRNMMRKLCDDFRTPLVTSPNSLCTDNAAMIAWMGHELMRCEQDVDIRDMQVDGIPKIPLGSYVRDLMLANNKQKKGGLSKHQVTMKHGS